MYLSDLMDVGTVADNKDSIIYYDSETHDPIFGPDGKPNGDIFLICCGGDEKTRENFLHDVLIDDPEENGCDIEVTDIMAQGSRLVLELDHDSVVGVLKDRLACKEEIEKENE